MDRESNKRMVIKLMNAEMGLRNLDDFIEANNIDEESRDYEALVSMSTEIMDAADKVSDLTEKARALKEDD